MGGLRRVLAAAAVVAVAAVGLSSVASARADKVEICHWDHETGQFSLINISNNGRAIAAHEAHGDGHPGDVVPDSDGSFEFDPLCNPVAVNSSPDAIDDDVATDEDTALNGNVLADNGNGADSDPEGDPLTVTAVDGNPGDVGAQVTLGSGALVTIDAAGIFSYDPNGQFESLGSGDSATNTFTYTIEDRSGASDTATVTVTITGVDDCITNEAELRAAAAAGGDHCVDAANPIILTTGFVGVATTLSLSSAGPGNATIDANATSRVFDVTATGDLTLTDITVTGGQTTGPVPRDRDGGGIYNEGGSVTLNGATSVTGNTADGGGAGGGMYNQGGSVTMNDSSSVTNNTGTGSLNKGGGGMMIDSGTLVMNGSSSVSDNTANYVGGININAFNGGPAGSVTMNDSSSVTDNSASTLIGGIHNRDAAATLTLNGSSSVSGNVGDFTNGILNYGTVFLNDVSSVPDGIRNDLGGTVIDSRV